jgi:Kef-type K+ transport system membrane component KefB
LNVRESVQLGAGMVSRGEVGLIVANVGINEGLVGSDQFSAIVGMVLVTTLVTPPILRALFAQSKPKTQTSLPETDQGSSSVDPQNEEAT